jgi:uncharacterized protein YodC (DUF2158 family)
VIQLSIGDVVSFKSGGQGMTVEEVNLNMVGCVWLSRDGRVRRDTFPSACLRHGDSRFDGIADLVIEGVTHSSDEIDVYLKAAGNA